MARVWLVDDQEQWLELFENALRDAGYEVLAFTDGYTALSRLKSGAVPPDAVVLDVQMKPSGAEVLRAIRETCRELPVVMNTSCAGCRERAELASATGFVTKHTDPRSLLEALTLVLSRAREA